MIASTLGLLLLTPAALGVSIATMTADSAVGRVLYLVDDGKTITVSTCPRAGATELVVLSTGAAEIVTRETARDRQVVLTDSDASRRRYIPLCREEDLR